MNENFAHRGLSIEELDAIAAGKFTWGGFFGAVAEGAGIGAVGGAGIGGIAGGPVGAAFGAGIGASGGGYIAGYRYLITHIFEND